MGLLCLQLQSLQEGLVSRLPYLPALLLEWPFGTLQLPKALIPQQVLPLLRNRRAWRPSAARRLLAQDYVRRQIKEVAQGLVRISLDKHSAAVAASSAIP